MIKNLGNTIVITLMILFCSSSICLAQKNANKNTSKDKLISKGNNENPVGELGVTTYRLEQIKLEKPIISKEEQLPIETAFRLTVMTKEALPIGSYSIWVENVQWNALVIKPNAVAIIIYSRTLQNGVTLALSKIGSDELNNRTILPERLFVPNSYATPFEEIQAGLPVIELRRIALQNPLTEIRIKIPGRECRIGNALIVLEISGKEFGLDCDDEIFIYQFNNQEFAQLIDGAEIIIKYGVGRESRNRSIVGRLNKSSIQ